MALSASIREKGLKATPSRLRVIEKLAIKHEAYAHAELEVLFSDMDRVTLYRVLNDFEEAGLVHKIIDMGGVTRFALCNKDCPHAHHEDNHVHFNCSKCHRMFCLDQVAVPVIKNIPPGYEISGTNTVIYGLCQICNAA